MARFRVLALVVLASSALFACAQILGFDKDYPDGPGSIVMNGEAGASSSSGSSSGEPGPGSSTSGSSSGASSTSSSGGSSTSSSSSSSSSSGSVAIATPVVTGLGNGTLLVESGNLVWTDEAAGTISWRGVDAGTGATVVDAGAGAMTITSRLGTLVWAHIDGGAMVSQFDGGTTTFSPGFGSRVLALAAMPNAADMNYNNRLFGITAPDVLSQSTGASYVTVRDAGVRSPLFVAADQSNICACFSTGTAVECMDTANNNVSTVPVSNVTALSWTVTGGFPRLLVLSTNGAVIPAIANNNVGHCGGVGWAVGAALVSSGGTAVAGDGTSLFFATHDGVYVVTATGGRLLASIPGDCVALAAGPGALFCRTATSILRIP